MIPVNKAKPKPVEAKQLESSLRPQHYTDQLRALEKRNLQLIDELRKQTGQLENLSSAHTLIKSTNAALTNENKILHERTTVLQGQLDTKTKDDSAFNIQLENLNIAYAALEATNLALLNEKKSLQTTVDLDLHWHKPFARMCAAQPEARIVWTNCGG